MTRLSRERSLVIIVLGDVLLASKPPDENATSGPEPIGGRFTDVLAIGKRGRVQHPGREFSHCLELFGQRSLRCGSRQIEMSPDPLFRDRLVSRVERPGANLL